MSTPVDSGLVRQLSGALTAADTRMTTFRQSPLGWRGYLETDVDDFVDHVADLLETAERDRSALRAEVERLRGYHREQSTGAGRIGGTRSDPAELPAAGEHSHRRTHSPLVRELDRYSETLVSVAADCADSAVCDDTETRERRLYQARVRARLFVDELISTFLADPRDLPRAEDELLLLTGWMRAFGEALLAQVDAMVLVADHHVRSDTAWR
jgi:DivIVA domain-containing protein